MQDAVTPDERYLFLLGQPPLHEYVRFVKTRAIDGRRLDEVALTREWTARIETLRDLQQSDPYEEDLEPLIPLGPSVAEEAEAFSREPWVEKSLGFLPRQWAQIDLDRLIVSQKYVNCAYAATLAAQLSRQPSDRELLQVVTGQLRPLPPVRVVSRDGHNFTFASISNDINVLGIAPLVPAEVSGYRPGGRVQTVLGIFVGYGPNLLWAIHWGNRLMLANGTHRAYGLRALGVRHVPCLVTHARTEDEVALALGSSGVKTDLVAAFRRKRPLLLRDYFNKALTKEVICYPYQHSIQLSMSFVQSHVPRM